MLYTASHYLTTETQGGKSLPLRLGRPDLNVFTPSSRRSGWPNPCMKKGQFVDYLIRDTILLKQGAINVPPLQRPVLPANIAPTPGGNKEDIIEQHMSRFH